MPAFTCERARAAEALWYSHPLWRLSIAKMLADWPMIPEVIELTELPVSLGSILQRDVVRDNERGLCLSGDDQVSELSVVLHTNLNQHFPFWVGTIRRIDIQP